MSLQCAITLKRAMAVLDMLFKLGFPLTFCMTKGPGGQTKLEKYGISLWQH